MLTLNVHQKYERRLLRKLFDTKVVFKRLLARAEVNFDPDRLSYFHRVAIVDIHRAK